MIVITTTGKVGSEARLLGPGGASVRVRARNSEKAPGKRSVPLDTPVPMGSAREGFC